MQRALKAFEGARPILTAAPRAPAHAATSSAASRPGKAMYNLAHSYMKLGDRIAALQFFQDCVPVVRKSGDWQVEIYCNMKVAQLSVDKCVRAATGAGPCLPSPNLTRSHPRSVTRQRATPGGP